MSTLLQIQDLQFVQEKSPTRNPTLAACRQKVPAQILAHFDRLLARGKKGVSTVRNGVCGECHMRLPIGSVAVLAKGSDLQLCGSCGRYLYLPETEQILIATAKAKAKERKPAAKKRKTAAPAHVA